MDNEPRFAADLYQGTASYYDHYRLPYPEAMTGHLIQRARISGRGRLLDLACGTGQLTFPLRQWFSEVWAVDREPDMVEVLRAKAVAMEAGNIRPTAADAETLDAEPEHFELAVIGNAFHRLDRDLVAGRLLRWLRPGGCVALCWSSGPQAGDEQWQRALAAGIGRWRRRLGAERRVPANWDQPRRRRPDHQVLSDAGFEVAGRQEFIAEHRWTLPELAGYVRSTSVLPASVLGNQGTAFDADLEASLGPLADGDAFPETVSFAYDLGRRPQLAGRAVLDRHLDLLNLDPCGRAAACLEAPGRQVAAVRGERVDAAGRQCQRDRPARRQRGQRLPGRARPGQVLPPTAGQLDGGSAVTAERAGQDGRAGERQGRGQ
jgi:SAM-dependent methyltransferase